MLFYIVYGGLSWELVAVFGGFRKRSCRGSIEATGMNVF